MDAVDVAQQQIEADEAARRPPPFVLDPGVAGDCIDCGESKPRLIDGKCGRCRDRVSTNGGW